MQRHLPGLPVSMNLLRVHARFLLAGSRYFPNTKPLFSPIILVVRFLLLKSVRFLCRFIHSQDSPNDGEANIERRNNIGNERDSE